MRKEIMKFRAFDGFNKKFTYWTMNDLCTWDSKDEKPSALEEWMQYTGLLDKNGKEIFEGDILHVWEHNCDDKGVVRYSEDRCAFIVGKYGCTVGEFENIEIIGNIYENKNLLTN